MVRDARDDVGPNTAITTTRFVLVWCLLYAARRLRAVPARRARCGCGWSGGGAQDHSGADRLAVYHYGGAGPDAFDRSGLVSQRVLGRRYPAAAHGWRSSTPRSERCRKGTRNRDLVNNCRDVAELVVPVRGDFPQDPPHDLHRTASSAGPAPTGCGPGSRSGRSLLRTQSRSSADRAAARSASRPTQERHVRVDALPLDVVRIADDRRLGDRWCATSALSTSAVPRRWPATFSTSSTRPVIQ